MTVLTTHLERMHQQSIRAPLKSPQPGIRIGALTEITSRWINAYGMAMLTATARKDAVLQASIVQWLDSAIAEVLKLDDALAAFTHKEQPKQIENQGQRLAAAFAALARAKGSISCLPDTLFALTIQHAAPEDRQFIGAMGAPKLPGWLKLPAVIEELRDKHRVLTFAVDGDRNCRLIDLDWLVNHADIVRHVKTPQAGMQCRFCRLRESGKGALTLVAADQQEQTSGTGLDARGQRIDMHAKSGYVHRECLESWNKWVSIAKQYESEVEAADADRAAGRVAAEPPPMPASEEPEPEPEPAPVDAGMRSDYYGTTPQFPYTPQADTRPTTSELHNRMLRRRRARKGLDDGN